MEREKIIKEMKDFSKNYANIPEYIYSLDLDKVEILLGYINNLKQQLKKKQDVIDKAVNLVKLYGRYDGEKCTRNFKMMAADFNKLLDILKEVK